MNLKVLDEIRSLKDESLCQFQKDGVVQMLKRKHNLLADEPGLGKSVQAITYWEVLGLRNILIVTKASLKSGIKKHIEYWPWQKRVIQIIDKRTDYVTELSEIVIVNYELVGHSYIHQQLRDVKWDLLVCDEAHSLKNMDTQRTKAILSKTGLAHCATRTLMITGTPILNRPVELYPMLKVLAPAVIAPYNDYERFAKRYCAAYSDGFSLNVSGASHTDELNLKLRQHYMIRRLTHEVGLQLPPKRYEILFIDATEGVRTGLRQLDQANRTDFKYQNVSANGGQLARLRREIAEKKVEAAGDLIKEYAQSVDKLVIFAYHHTVIEKLETELRDLGTITLTGTTPAAQRAQRIDAFQNDGRIKVFIGQIQAAGEGIDGLQNVCSNVLFVETSWVPGEIEQAIKRVDRMGQKNSVLVRFLIWADSIEEHMMRVALEKVKTIREVVK